MFTISPDTIFLTLEWLSYIGMGIDEILIDINASSMLLIKKPLISIKLILYPFPYHFLKVSKVFFRNNILLSL